MSANAVGRLLVIDDTLNGRKYVDSIPQPKFVLSARDISPDNAPFFYQQDLASCHYARICKQSFPENDIQVLVGPGNSPDLDPHRTFMILFGLYEAFLQ